MATPNRYNFRSRRRSSVTDQPVAPAVSAQPAPQPDEDPKQQKVVCLYITPYFVVDCHRAPSGNAWIKIGLRSGHQWPADVRRDLEVNRGFDTDNHFTPVRALYRKLLPSELADNILPLATLSRYQQRFIEASQKGLNSEDEEDCRILRREQLAETARSKRELQRSQLLFQMWMFILALVIGVSIIGLGWHLYGPGL